MNDLLTAIKDNWEVIAEAPAPFAVWVLVVTPAIWGIVNWANDKRISDLNSRMLLKDDIIAEYRRKLDGATPQQAHDRIENLEARIANMEASPLAALKNADGVIEMDGGEVSAERRSPLKPDTVSHTKLAYRRKLIDDGRKIVTDFNRYGGEKDLLAYLASYQGWPAIRAHIAKDVITKIEDSRLIVIADDGLRDGKLGYLIDELDRLERQWDLT